MQQLMFKNTPLLEIENYGTKILDYDHLPYSLRYEDVNYDGIFHMWTELRMLSIGRSNAKKILNALRVSQNNMYALGKALHFVSLTDCYWINENERLTWDEVNLYKNPFNTDIAEIALFGTEKRIVIPLEKIQTPELTTHGFAAKAWIWEKNGLFLYKIGRRELVADYILQELGTEHIPYFPVSEESLLKIVSEEKLEKIENSGEQIVKCKCICNEDTSIISWEDFCVYAERNNFDPYDYIRNTFPVYFSNMILSDYILGNDDRHTANWGFFVDNSSGQITKPYPLMDHDHAFSNGRLYCQTWPEDVYFDEVIDTVAKDSALNILSLFTSNKPKGLRENDWIKVIDRAHGIEKILPLLTQINNTKHAISGSKEISDKSQNIER